MQNRRVPWRVLVVAVLANIAADVRGQTVYTFPSPSRLPPWVNAISSLRFPSDRLEVSLTPIPEADLFLTVVFQENKNEDILSVGWRSGETEKCFAENLFEGIVGTNKRTIRLSGDALTGPGILTIACERGGTPLLKARLEWVKPTSTFVSTDQEPPGFLESGGTVLAAASLAGTTLLSPPDNWQGGLLEVFLQEKLESLDGNIEVVVPLSGVPTATVLRAQFFGVPLGESPVLWVNGTRLGEIPLVIPGLADAGYLREDRAFVYAGWRLGTLFIPSQLLRVGANTLLVETPTTGVFMKLASLQFLPDKANEPALGIEESAAASNVLEHPPLAEAVEIAH